MSITFKQVLQIAKSLGDAEESTSYGTPAVKIGSKLVARLKEDGESLVVGTTYEERTEMMAAEPNTYYITDHYLNAPWVLVRLSRVHPDALRDLLARAIKLGADAARKKPTSAAKRARNRKPGP